MKILFSFQNFQNFFLLIFILFFTYFLFSYYFLVSEKFLGKIKRPKGFPFLGHITYFTPSINLNTLKVFYLKYGPVYEMFLFSKRFLVVTNIENIKEILMKRPKYFRRDITIESGFKELNLVPNGLFIAEGQIWNRLRRILSTPFNKPNSDAMSSFIILEIKQLIRQLKFTQMKLVNVIQPMIQFTLHVIMRVAMGNFHSNEYLTNGNYIKDATALFDFIIIRSGTNDFIWNYLRPHKSLHKLAIEANQRLEKLVQSVIDHKHTSDSNNNNNNNKNNESKSKTFIDIIIQNQTPSSSSSSSSSSSNNNNNSNNNIDNNDNNDNNNNILSDDEIVASIKTMILAGSETTSVALSWSLYFLSQHKSHFERLRKEADEKLPSLDKVEKFESRVDLPFTAACFREALRIYPPGPFMGCNLINKDAPYTLSTGLTIQPNDCVMLYLEGPHFDETIFPNPNEFNPLRWIESDSKTLEKMNSNYLPFGYGGRICPGMHLAQHEGELVLGYIVRYFDIELGCRPEEVKRIQSFTARPRALPMKFIPRTSKLSVYELYTNQSSNFY